MKNSRKLAVVVIVALIAVILICVCFSGFFLTKIKEYRITKIAGDYHNIHTYSSDNFFNCLDMTIDLWNIYKTAGYNAKIALGNTQNANTSIEEINHAWLMVEISPFKWVAIETTQGQIINLWQNGNKAYYGNLFTFHTPAQVKKYIEIRILYLDKSDELKQIGEPRCTAYRKNIYDYNQLVTSYNIERTKSVLGASYDVSLVQSITDKMNVLKTEIAVSKEHCEEENKEYSQKLDEIQILSEKLALLML